MSISKCSIIGLSLFLSIGSFTVKADDKPLVIGGLIAPPHIMQTNSGEAIGVIVDQVKLASKLTGIPVEFRLNNWARSFREIKEHKIDALIPTMYSADRTEFLHYPDTPMLIWKSTLFKKRGSDVTYNGNLEDLHKYQVGRIRNARVSPAFDQAVNDGALKIEEKNSALLLMRSLAKGRLDLAATSLYVGAWSAQQDYLWDEVEPLKPLLGAVPVYLAFSKKNVAKSIVEKFDQTFKKFQENGTFEEITEQYLD